MFLVFLLQWVCLFQIKTYNYPQRLPAGHERDWDTSCMDAVAITALQLITGT